MPGEHDKLENPIMNNFLPPSPLVNVTRGDEMESLHCGHYAVAAPDGSIVEGSGDIHFVTYPRSALKPIQALQLITSGAADAYGLESTHLSLACSSHWAEPFHVDAVSRPNAVTAPIPVTTTLRLFIEIPQTSLTLL